MPKKLRLGEQVGDFVVVELAGRVPASALYLALRPSDRRYYWLLSSDTPLDQLAAIPPDHSAFEVKKQAYAAFPVQSLSLAALATLVPVLDPAFIGWRWAGLAES